MDFHLIFGELEVILLVVLFAMLTGTVPFKGA